LGNSTLLRTIEIPVFVTIVEKKMDAVRLQSFIQEWMFKLLCFAIFIQCLADPLQGQIAVFAEPLKYMHLHEIEEGNAYFWSEYDSLLNPAADIREREAQILRSLKRAVIWGFVQFCNFLHFDTRRQLTW